MKDNKHSNRNFRAEYGCKTQEGLFKLLKDNKDGTAYFYRSDIKSWIMPEARRIKFDWSEMF